MATHASTFFGRGAWCFSIAGGDINPSDDMESYTDFADVNGLNGGIGWPSGYVARGGDVSVRAFDNMETYSNGASVNALNGGAGWNGAYVDR